MSSAISSNMTNIPRCRYQTLKPWFALANLCIERSLFHICQLLELSVVQVRGPLNTPCYPSSLIWLVFSWFHYICVCMLTEYSTLIWYTVLHCASQNYLKSASFHSWKTNPWSLLQWPQLKRRPNRSVKSKSSSYYQKQLSSGCGEVFTRVPHESGLL